MESTQKKYEQTCLETDCMILNVSLFEYSVTITKEWYKTLEYRYKPNKKNITQELILEKKYELESVEFFSQQEAATLLKNQDTTISIEDKIQLIKENQDVFYRVEKLNNTYKFKKNVNWLELYKNNKFLGNFQNSAKSEIKVIEILWDENHLFLELWKNKYLFSLVSWENKKIIFEIPITYIKSWSQNWEYIFVTHKGSFLFNSYKNIFSYNSIFSDYIIFEKDSYIGIINSDDIKRKQKFNLDSSSKNVILQYNPQTKEQKLLLETTKNLMRLFKKDWEIFIQETNKNYFTITHLQEK
jgi:hypothetical protein